MKLGKLDGLTTCPALLLLWKMSLTKQPPNYRDKVQSLLTPPWQASAFRIVKMSQSHLLQEPGVTLSSFSHWGCPHKHCLFILFPSKMLWEAGGLLSSLRCRGGPTIPIFPREEILLSPLGWRGRWSQHSTPHFRQYWHHIEWYPDRFSS